MRPARLLNWDPMLHAHKQLVHEKSPYLLQHAHNPVDWHPWGEEAFAKARRRGQADLPLHRLFHLPLVPRHGARIVRESTTIAAMLNRISFRSRWTARSAPTWTASTCSSCRPRRAAAAGPCRCGSRRTCKPFYGGTYFPPDRPLRRGPVSLRAGAASPRPGTTDRAAHPANPAPTILDELTRHTADCAGARDRPDVNAVSTSGFHAFRRTFDAKHGGFGSAPKFPRPSTDQLPAALLAPDAATGSARHGARHAARDGRGGMNDQLGGGFHRYSVDERWFVPHFEKMLYDQAQLAVSYLEAFQITGDACACRSGARHPRLRARAT